MYPDTVWVIMPDYHTEGLREPIQAFFTEAEAVAAMKLLEHGHQSFKLASVPVWGRTPIKQGQRA